MMWPTPDAQNARDGSSLRAANNLAAGGFHAVSLHHAIEHPDSPYRSAVGGDASDTVNRTHRLKALGNGIVPACAYPFARAIADALEAE